MNERIEDTRQPKEYSENFCDECGEYCHIDDLVSLTPLLKKSWVWSSKLVCPECESKAIESEREDEEVIYKEHLNDIEILWMPEIDKE